MNPEQWKQIKDLFADVVQCDPAQREQILNQACGGDSALRTEILSLLASQSDSDSLFNALETIRESVVKSAFSSLHPGDTVIHYKILEKIGQGGMGEVYKAEDLKLKRTVALKVLCAAARKQEDTRLRLLREARTAATLHHQNVATIFSIEVTSDSDFIVMEYIEGETLKKKLESGPLPFTELRTVGLQICDALEAAHSIGLIHRDIKPENILLNSQSKVKVVDFGLAKNIVSGEKDLTGPGIVAGTICYMSPEQVNGKTLDQQSDIFSLGSVLYYAATGKLPFEGPNLLSTMHAINTSDPVAPSILIPDLPAELDRILLRALAKEKQARYASIQDLARDLRSLTETKLQPSISTILFVEVIDPVVTVANFGEMEWHRASRSFQESSKQILREFDGEQIVLEPGGLLATFQDPGRAAKCAAAVIRAAQSQSLPARSALHVADRRDPSRAYKSVADLCRTGNAGDVLYSNSFRMAIEKMEKRSSKRNYQPYIVIGVLLVLLAAGVWFRHRKSAIPIYSIAVLPFTSASVNPNVQYFSDFLTENLISQLSQIRTVKVMARGTVFSYKGREVDPRTVGQDLHVDAVVTGSIFQQAETLIIYVDLVRVKDGSVIWGAEYSRRMSDLLPLQQEISREIFGQLRLKLMNSPETRPQGGS
jgi:serine/threonine protein kinase